MSNKCQIHETVLRDIIDIMTDVKDNDEIQIFMNKNKVYKSVASASNDLVLVFPVVCSRAVHIENASMVTKAIERKAASMLQMLFSAYQMTDADNAVDFIHKFHTNVNFGGNNMTVDSFIDTIDKIAQMDESGIECINPNLVQAIKEELKDMYTVLPDSVNETAITSYRVMPETARMSARVIQEAPSRTAPQIVKDINDGFQNQLLATDVKKANELVPTTMIVNFVTTKGDVPVKTSGVIIGVKAKLYPVDSQDLINHVKSKVADTNWLNTLIRASTKEISFWKDFVFAIDKAKIDALSNSRRGSASKMWKVLERRALKSRIRRGTSTINDATAITSLVLSQEEVEYLKKMENINIEEPRVFRALLESYNLMAIVIVDEAMEVCKFVFDTGDDTYETIGFNLLEREASDNSYKKIVNLMTKVAR
jgi:hypothetical protein